MTTEEARCGIFGLARRGSNAAVLAITCGLVASAFAPEQKARASSTAAALQPSLPKRAGSDERSETDPDHGDQDDDSAESNPDNRTLSHWSHPLCQIPEWGPSMPGSNETIAPRSRYRSLRLLVCVGRLGHKVAARVDGDTGFSHLVESSIDVAGLQVDAPAAVED